jgi:Co/Zn/Cd efflux system component
MPHDHSHHEHAHHGHPHGHAGHSHAPAAFGRAFAIGAALNAAFVALQVFYGLAANSVALLADAVHNLGDVLGLLIAWGAATLTRRAPTPRRTYGWGRSSILAALGNAVILLLSCGAIAVEAAGRFGSPAPVAAWPVMLVAAAGIIVNGGTALLFLRGRHGDLNVRGAFLHMVGDAAVSLGVVVSSALILWTGWQWLDPLTSLGIVAADHLEHLGPAAAERGPGDGRRSRRCGPGCGAGRAGTVAGRRGGARPTHLGPQHDPHGTDGAFGPCPPGCGAGAGSVRYAARPIRPGPRDIAGGGGRGGRKVCAASGSGGVISSP